MKMLVVNIFLVICILKVTLLASGGMIDEAAANGYLDSVKSYVKYGISPEDLDSGLRRAAERGHLDIVKYLLEQGANLNSKGAVSGAATYGHLEVLKYLLDEGANITCDRRNSSCPWHWAAKYGHPDVIALLVDNGIDINKPLEVEMIWYDGGLKYNKGWTAMHFAARSGYPMIKELMELGADINARDVKGQTPLHIAIQAKKFIFAKEMLRFCADFTPRDENGKSALDMARELELHKAKEVHYMQVVTSLKERLQERIDISPNNYRTERNITIEFTALVKADPDLHQEIWHIVKYPYFISTALQYLFEQRARDNMTRILKEHKCREFSPTFNMVPIGTEYMAKCDCIPGQGPMMTISSPITHQQPDSNINQCVSTEPPIQEAASSDSLVSDDSIDIPMEPTML